MEALKWSARPLEETLKDTVACYREKKII